MRGNKQGLGAISAYSVGFGVKGAIITFSGYGSEQAVSGLMETDPGKSQTNTVIS